MYGAIKSELQSRLAQLHTDGLYKNERVIKTPQGALISVKDGLEVVNFCANNYLGLANNPDIRAAAKRAVDEWGYGLSSVRFICGTQDPHKLLERALSDFLGTEDTILFSSCFDANGGVFEPLLDSDSAIITDSLNHASIIDGIRLCKAERFIYQHNDFKDLEDKLKAASTLRFRMIATDGVFSMDGDIADLRIICDLADKYDAMVLVDDSHATGFVGKRGRGTHEHCGVMGRVDIITTTFGKALGGTEREIRNVGTEITTALRARASISPISPRTALIREQQAARPSGRPTAIMVSRRSEPGEPVGSAKQRILNALSFLEGIGLPQADKTQLALMAGVSPTSGGYFNNLGALRTGGLITYPGPSAVALTPDGRACANPAQAPATTQDLHALIQAKLPRAKWRLLEVLIAVYPKPLAKDELAARAGVSPTSGGYFNNLGSLRSLGLIDYPTPGHAVARPVLFLEEMR